MIQLKDMRILGVVVITLANIIQVSTWKSEDHPPETKEIKACLLECMACREFWGAMYNGHACANRCFRSNGERIDQDCTLGANIAKRYEEIKATDQCKKQCEICATKYSSRNYDLTKCLETCSLTTGQDRDSTCSKYLTFFKLADVNQKV